MKNSFAPVTRIPPEVLSLIPDYYDEDDGDRDLTALTHVCRRWRETFISRSLLWNRFDLTNTDKTRTYIQRSRSSPLKFHLANGKDIKHAFPLIIPHIHRLRSLSVSVWNTLTSVLEDFRYPTPLLEKLVVIALPGRAKSCVGLFNGDLPLLRELIVSGIDIHLPWKNLKSLQVVRLHLSSKRYGATQFLDFLESAPLLHTLSLRFQAASDSSDASPERMVSLRHLKTFTINPYSRPSILLHHLHIPTRASLISEFDTPGEESPFPDYLTKRFVNFSNISDVTAINLLLDSDGTSVRFSGPSGSLRVIAYWEYAAPHTVERQIFRSLGPILSATRVLTISDRGRSRATHWEDNHNFKRLVIAGCGDSESTEVQACPIFQILSSTDNLRTIILDACYYLFFTRALDPEQHPSNLLLCPNLEELLFYRTYLEPFEFKQVSSMARNRASRGAKLSLIGLPGRGKMSRSWRNTLYTWNTSSKNVNPSGIMFPVESGGKNM